VRFGRAFAAFLARGHVGRCVVSSRRHWWSRGVALAYKTPTPAAVSPFPLSRCRRRACVHRRNSSRLLNFHPLHLAVSSA
jgi:hypothetical protein